MLVSILLTRSAEVSQSIVTALNICFLLLGGGGGGVVRGWVEVDRLDNY